MVSSYPPRVWFITGCSSGLGYALSEAVIASGEKAVLTARRPEHLVALVAQAPERVLPLALDVTQPESVALAVETSLGRFAGLDVVVNNAGYGLMGVIEALSDQQVRRQFDTNVFGLLNVTRAVLPGMRRARRGHIVNISAATGMVGVECMGAYCASKFAVEGLSEALAQEVAPFGIKVTVVKPGSLRTNWAGKSLEWAQHHIPEYAPATGRLKEKLEQENGAQPEDPVRTAQAILAAVNAPEPPLHLPLGPDALEAISRKLNALTEEVSRWEKVIRDTSYPP